MSDEEFAEFCTLYSDYFIEMTAEGEIVIMPPNYSLTGSQSGEIVAQQRNWASADRRGIVTDASAGFRLPDAALLAPDAAWTLKSRILELSASPVRGFWRLCPNFVIELHTDRLRVSRANMQEWIDNGARLAWLIDPEREAVEIYRPRQDPETLIGVESIAGEGPVEGFALDLRRVRDPFAG